MTDVRSPILVLGGSGMLGEALRRNAVRPVYATYASRPFAGGIHYLAGGDLGPLLDALPSVPSALLLLFSQSSIDACFRDPAAARRINVDGIAQAVATASRRGIPVTFVSTDAVFDGSRSLWRDTDTPEPILEYGRQKREAEKIVLAEGSNLVVRLPKLIAGNLHAQCFVSGWLRDLRAGRCIDCAVDQWFNPVGADDAARAILALLDISPQGVVHVATTEVYSRWDLLNRLLDGLNPTLIPQRAVLPCKLAELRLSEPRPIDTSLYPSPVIARLPFAIRPPKQIIDDRARAFIRLSRRALVQP